MQMCDFMNQFNKKVMNVVLVLMFLLVALFCFEPQKAYAAENRISGDWEYSVSSGEVKLVSYHGNSTDINIPSSIGGYPVTQIGERIFEDSVITSLSIPSSIEQIENRAFAKCKYLSYIYFDAPKCKVYYFRSMMDLHVFQDAGKFSQSLKVEFGPHVKVIPTSMFEASEEDYAHITDVVISDKVETIGAWAFQNCFDLKNVTWGENIQRIEEGAFGQCTFLSNVVIPEKTEYIGSNAFAGCKQLEEIKFNAKNCKAYMFRSSMNSHVFVDAGKQSTSLKVIFGSKVETVPASLFEAPETQYAHITEVSIPRSVKYIGDFAFNNCIDLKKITIKGKTQLSFEDWTNPFNGCSKKLKFVCLKDSDADKFASQYGFAHKYLNTSKPKIVYITNMKKNTVEIKWNDISTASGYEVQYSIRKDFKHGRLLKNVMGNSKKIKLLSKGKKYYIRLRTYKMVNNEVYYSAWSNIKSISIIR